MSTPKVGNKAPDFTLPATGDRKIKLSALQGQDFRDRHAAFAKHGAVILGVSRDGLKSHENFKAKQGFPFELLADTEETACQRYDVIKEKNMYGRKVLGVERSTFLIDAAGKLAREWRKVKVKGHVDEVLDAVAGL